MAPSKKPLRYAHSDGHTDLCYDTSGRYLLTCGLDGDARIWDGVEDDDAISHRAGDKVYAIAFKNDRFFTASDSNSVQAYTFPDGAPDGIITRFTSPVTHMCLNSSGSTLVAGASDFSIKVVDVESCEFRALSGHEAPVLSVALHPNEDMVASSSCDGTVRVWSIVDQKTVQSWKVVPKSNDVSLSKTLCRLCWEPQTGKNLVVPVEKEVHVYERDSWKKVHSLTDGSIKELVSIVTFSPCGNYLAASCVDGVVCVWDWKTKKCVSRTKHDKNLMITALAWNPKGNNEMAYCDNQGQLGLIEAVVSADAPEQDPVDGAMDPTEGVFDDDDDFLLRATGDDGIPGGDNPDSDQDDDPFNLPIKKPGVLDDLQSNDDVTSVMSDLDGADSTAGAPRTSAAPTLGPKPTPLQKAFQSGSTPEHLSARFMKWNSVGIIRQYSSDEENSIDVEFHDTAIHHAMHFNNDSGYTLADVSTEAVVLAAEADDSVPSKLFCMHFASWDNSKDWSVTMPDGENIEALCLGGGWIAVATDQRNVRLLSVGGVQRELFSIPGPVVSLAGHHDQLLVVFHRGTGVPGDQCLGCILLHVGSRRKSLLGGESVPLSPRSTLNWLGFSAEGTPGLVDSSGVVRLLNRSLGNTWIQVCNTNHHARGKSDHYWIVGVHENPQQLRCIMCKGSKFPPTLPRPMVSVLPYQLPLCELSTEKSQYEETLLRSRLLSNHLSVLETQGYEVDDSVKIEMLKPAQEALMKLFALSARSDRECRAVEVCEMMPDQHTLQLAIKYASRLRRMQLAERISDVARRKAEEETPENQEEDYLTAPSIRSGRPEAVGRSGWNGHRRPTTKRGLIGQEEEEGGVSEDEAEEDMEQEDQTEETTGPRLNLTAKVAESKPSEPTAASLLRKNPFKVSTPQKTHTVVKGSKVFDDMAKEKKTLKSPTLPLTVSDSKKKASSQIKLFKAKSTKSSENKKPTENGDTIEAGKKKTAYQLWFQENQTDISEEHPELSAEELQTMAAEKFRELPKEERQVWLKKSRGEVESDTDKKRKRHAEPCLTPQEVSQKKSKTTETAEKTKNPLSQSTNSKLANFAFSKLE
ncbi:WD repeat and HMG-box DNA-binding protein 1-like [Liolophura sinensis]|uniref:WD repeat and HMG-box DNA-binding protein 1-like n=1 Tax=Liolophura sinensis TaxID=3198878 RepID=UPI003158ED14